MSTYVQLGDQKIVFEWDANKYNRLLRKYFSLVDIAMIEYEKFLDSAKYDGSFPSKAESLAYILIEEMYKSLSNELVELGYYGCSYERIKEGSNFYLNVKSPLDKVFMNLRHEATLVQLQRQRELHRVAMRQASRGRIVGGGFGLGGFIKGALTASAINSVRDSWNSSGDRADIRAANRRATNATLDIYSEFVEAINNAFRKASLSFYNAIVKQMGIYDIKLKPDEAEAIITNILNETITGDKVFPALVHALNVFPYEKDIYRLLMNNNIDYYKDIEKIGDIFILDSDSIFNEYHKLHDYYFDDPRDMLYTLEYIHLPIVKLQLKHSDSKAIVYNDPEYFIKSHNFALIDGIIAHLNSVRVDPAKKQIAEYYNKQVNFYKNLRNNMEFNSVSRHEAVAGLSFTTHSNENIFRYNEKSNSIPGDVLKAVKTACPSLSGKFLYITIRSDNRAIAVMTTDELALINIPSYSDGKIGNRIEKVLFKYEDLEKCYLTDDILTCTTPSGYAPTYKFTLSKKNSKTFNEYISSILDPNKLPEDIKETILSTHKEMGKVISKEEWAKNEKEILHRTYEGVVYKTREEVDQIKAEIAVIQYLTNDNVFSTDFKTLTTWKEALLKKNIVTKPGKELIEKINLLSSY